MPPLRRYGASPSGGAPRRPAAGSPVPLRSSGLGAALFAGLAALLVGSVGCRPPTGTADEMTAPRHVIPRARAVTPAEPDALEPVAPREPRVGSLDAEPRARP